jgi:hypothetical protein
VATEGGLDGGLEAWHRRHRREVDERSRRGRHQKSGDRGRVRLEQHEAVEPDRGMRRPASRRCDQVHLGRRFDVVEGPRRGGVTEHTWEDPFELTGGVPTGHPGVADPLVADLLSREIDPS